MTALKGGEDRVARGTVYRTLSLLEHAGLIRKIHNQGGHRYELSLGEDRHDHLFCERCGRTFEFRDERLPVAIRQASQEDVENGRFDPVTLVEVYTVEWGTPQGKKSLQVRERSYVPTELAMLLRQAGFVVEHLWGGTAGDWGRRKIQLDEMEVMVVARKAANVT